MYVPGGTAVLPSSTLMLAVPAAIAGCKTIVMATPPRPDGSITPEVVYCAKKAGVTHVLKAGGAQVGAAAGKVTGRGEAEAVEAGKGWTRLGAGGRGSGERSGQGGKGGCSVAGAGSCGLRARERFVAALSARQPLWMPLLQ